MSLWYFLSDWFAGVPTYGMLFKRFMVNVAWAIALIFVMMFFQLPSECAVLVICGLFVVNGVMSFVFLRQHVQMHD